jgi:acetyltransferase-like isoleucine patch superfamily enzyme
VPIAAAADVSAEASIGRGTTIWGYAQVRERAVIGESCIIGRGAYIDTGVVVGSSCKIQNDALLYAPARLGDGVFVGPGAVLTNDVYPRAVTPDGVLKSAGDWHAQAVVIDDGASIGARAVVRAGVRIGEWALVGAGAVVVDDVPRHAMVVGVPARQIGWVSRTGARLTIEGDLLVCPESAERYRLVDGALEGPL